MSRELSHREIAPSARLGRIPAAERRVASAAPRNKNKRDFMSQVLLRCGQPLDRSQPERRHGDGGDVGRRRKHFVGFVRSDVHMGLTEPDGVVHVSGADDDI